MFTMIQVTTGNYNPFALGLCVLSDVIFTSALWWHARHYKKQGLGTSLQVNMQLIAYLIDRWDIWSEPTQKQNETGTYRIHVGPSKAGLVF